MRLLVQKLNGALFAILFIVIVMTASTGVSAGHGLFSGWFNDKPTGRHMVTLTTKQRPGTIIVSIGDRRLYKLLPNNKAVSYPIAIPDGKAFWSGVEPVSRKAVNPSWTPTASMRKENPKLPAFVPGGHPRNPLGVRALYLGSTLYRIHGTDAPWLIGKSVSRGCIRMYNEDVIDLYNRTRVGTKVIVTKKSFRTTASYTQNIGVPFTKLATLAAREIQKIR